MIWRKRGGQVRNSVSINTGDAITGKIDRFRQILTGKWHTRAFFSIQRTKTRFNIYGWNVRRSGWFKVPDVEIVPRRFSDLAKVMSFFTVSRTTCFLSWEEKKPKCTFKVGERFPRFIPPFASHFGKIFLFVYLRRFGSFDLDCYRIRILLQYHVCVRCSFS